MPWTKLDDHFWANPKITALPDTAFRLYVNALVWSGANLTDGRIPLVNASQLLGNLHGNLTRNAINHLVKSGLLEPDPEVKDVWWIHDYDEYQPTKTQVEQGRSDARDRKRKQRDKGNVTRDRPNVTRDVTRDHPDVSQRDKAASKVNASDPDVPYMGNRPPLESKRSANSMHFSATSSVKRGRPDPDPSPVPETESMSQRDNIHVTEPRPDPKKNSKYLSLTHTLTDTLNGPAEEDDDDEDDEAAAQHDEDEDLTPPANADTTLWTEATNRMTKQETAGATITHRRLYTEAIYTQLIADQQRHHRNLEQAAAVTHCPNCDNAGWITDTNGDVEIPTTRCNHIRAVEEA